MELTLKEYLIKFFGAKESFFEEGYYCKLNYKQGTVGFVSSSLISKISLGKSFIPLDKVFPNKKKLNYLLVPIQGIVELRNFIHLMELLKKR